MKLIILLLCASGCVGTAVNSNFVNDLDQTLAKAVSSSDCGEMMRIVKLGADPNQYDQNQATHLVYALKQRNLDGVRCLLDVGADPNKPVFTGDTPVSLAIGITDLRYLNLLMTRGGDPNVINSKTGEPISFRIVSANEGNRMEKLEVLLKHGLNLENRAIPQDSLGQPITLVLHAARFGKWDLVWKLIEHGADYKINTNSSIPTAPPSLLLIIRGQTGPYDFDRPQGMQQVIELFREQGWPDPSG
jgi:ankyrin repeat protein